MEVGLWKKKLESIKNKKMIRKAKIIIGVFLLALFSAGCGKHEESKEKQYEVYYLDRNENHISSVSYETITPKTEKEFLVKELLIQLETQLEDIEYKPVIVDFTVKDCIVREGQIALNFSKEYEMLEPAKEVLVRAAIVKTLTQIEGIELITMQVEGKSLLDAVGNTVGIMTADTFIDNTGEDMKKYEEVTLALYFANATGENLIKVNRTMRYNTNIALEKLVVEQLLSGPLEQKGKDNNKLVYPTLNSETKIISVSVKDGICYVNLSSPFLSLANNVTADIAIYSLVNSLTELPGILKVQLAVDGETEVTLGDKALSALFERNLDIIQVEEAKVK